MSRLILRRLKGDDRRRSRLFDFLTQALIKIDGLDQDNLISLANAKNRRGRPPLPFDDVAHVLLLAWARRPLELDDIDQTLFAQPARWRGPVNYVWASYHPGTVGVGGVV